MPDRHMWMLGQRRGDASGQSRRPGNVRKYLDITVVRQRGQHTGRHTAAPLFDRRREPDTIAAGIRQPHEWLVAATYRASHATRRPDGDVQCTGPAEPPQAVFHALLNPVAAAAPPRRGRARTVQPRRGAAPARPATGPGRDVRPARPPAVGPVARVRGHSRPGRQRVPRHRAPGRRLDRGADRFPTRPDPGARCAGRRRRLGRPPVPPGRVDRDREWYRPLPAPPAGS